MKKFKIVFFILSVVVFGAIGYIKESNKVAHSNELTKQALVFNNAIVASQDNVTKMLVTLEVRFSEAKTKENTILIVDSYIADIHTAINNLNKLESPQDSDTFRQSTLKLYNFYLKMLNVDYKERLIPLFYPEGSSIAYTELTNQTNDIFKQINSDRAQLNLEFSNSQKAFATEFNLDLEN